MAESAQQIKDQDQETCDLKVRETLAFIQTWISEDVSIWIHVTLLFRVPGDGIITNVPPPFVGG